MEWGFEISFKTRSEGEKREKEKWLDYLFKPISMRRTATREELSKNETTVTIKDTGARPI